MNWLICNICLQRRLNGVKTYYITNCAHLLCDKCIRSDATECPKCNKKCSVIQLNSRAPERVKNLFKDVSKERIVCLKRVLDVQHNQRSNLLVFHKETFKKYKKVKEALITSEKNVNILWHKYQASRAENSVLKRQIQDYESKLLKFQSTPIYNLQPNYLSPSNMYSQGVTPSRPLPNMNSSVFVSPDSMTSKTSSGSGQSADGTGNMKCWASNIADPSSFATPMPTRTSFNTSRRLP